MWFQQDSYHGFCLCNNIDSWLRSKVKTCPNWVILMLLERSQWELTNLNLGEKKGKILLQGLKIENFSHHKQTMLSILAGIPGHNHRFYNFNHWITEPELAVVNCGAIGFVGFLGKLLCLKREVRSPVWYGHWSKEFNRSRSTAWKCRSSACKSRGHQLVVQEAAGWVMQNAKG